MSTGNAIRAVGVVMAACGGPAAPIARGPAVANLASDSAGPALPALTFDGLGPYDGSSIDLRGLTALFPDLAISEREVRDGWTVLVATDRAGHDVFLVDLDTAHVIDPRVETPWPTVRVGATYADLSAAVSELHCVGVADLLGKIRCDSDAELHFGFVFPGEWPVGDPVPADVLAGRRIIDIMFGRW